METPETERDPVTEALHGETFIKNRGGYLGA